MANIDINIEDAWKTYSETENKRTVTVAIIDTGIDTTHSDLKDSIWVNEDEIPGDGIDNDGNGYIDDVYGWNFYDNNAQVFTGVDDNHGTHSAGTIAAARNGVGTVGICDPAYVKIMVIKTLGTSSGVGTVSNVVKAIRYAQVNGASICNLSFGTMKYSEELYQAIKDSGMLLLWRLETVTPPAMATASMSSRCTRQALNWTISFPWQTCALTVSSTVRPITG